MRHNWFGFFPEAFQQFVQCCASLVLGPGVVSTGAGPDGGQDAYFKGKLAFPFKADPWEGYGIIQIKYKSKTEGTKIDQQWMTKLLRQELAKLAANKKRKPADYYIIATNVALTPHPQGGRAKIESLMEEYRDVLQVKDYAIWDQAQFETFLNDHPTLGRRFAFYLANAEPSIHDLPFAPSIADKINSFIVKGFRSARLARLEEAGQMLEGATRLTQVFVDLPASIPDSERKSQSQFQFGRTSKKFVSHVSELSQSMVPEANPNKSRSEDAPAAKPTRESRILLSGEAGSGKTTCCVFLAQINRAAFLEQQRKPLAEGLQMLATELRHLASEDNIQWPYCPRVPFFVQLAQFSNALAKRPMDLETFLFELVTEGQPTSLDCDSFVRWLSETPYLIILDGFDEVPASANRSLIVSAIQDYCDRENQRNSDSMLLITTRPSAYYEELADCGLSKFSLLDLDESSCMLYAKRFASARCQAEIAMNVIEGIQKAVKEPTANLLTRSPLSLTVLMGILSIHPTLPSTEYGLFKQYFDVLYKREVGFKPKGELRTILKEQKEFIEELHFRLGLDFHVRNERGDEGQIGIKLEDFRALVHNSLIDKGLSETEVKQIVNEILAAVTERLILLRQNSTKEISFSIRSFQEFWAAEALCSGLDTETVDKLRAIAGHSHWQRVLQFACEKMFADKATFTLMCPAIFMICKELTEDSIVEETNAFSSLRAKLHLGALIAARLLAGNAIDHRAFEKRRIVNDFIRLGVNALQVPVALGLEEEEGTPADVILEKAYTAVCDSPKFDSCFYAAIQDLIARYSAELPVGLWAFLQRLCRKNVAWAKELREKHWSTKEPEASTRLVYLMEQGFSDNWTAEKWIEHAGRMNPMYHEKEGRYTLAIWLDTKTVPPWASAFFDITDEYLVEAELLDRTEARSPVMIRPQTIFPSYSDAENWVSFPNPNDEWLPYLAAARFTLDPNEQTLSHCLKELTQLWSRAGSLDDRAVRRLPWIVQVAVEASRNASELLSLSEACRKGFLGDATIWQAAEEGWVKNGVALNQFVNLDSIRSGGYQAGTLPALRWGIKWNRSSAEASNGFLTYLLETFAKESNPAIQVLIAYCSSFILAVDASQEEDELLFPLIDPEVYSQIANCLTGKWQIASAVCGFQWNEPLSSAWIDVIDRSYHQFHNLFLSDWERPNTKLGKMLEDCYAADPGKQGLLKALGIFTAMGYDGEMEYPGLLSSRNFTDLEVEAAAALCDLGRRHWKQGQGALLAHKILQLINQLPGFDELAWKCLGKHVRTDIEAAEFCRRLWEGLAPNDYLRRARMSAHAQRILAGQQVFRDGDIQQGVHRRASAV